MRWRAPARTVNGMRALDRWSTRLRRIDPRVFDGALAVVVAALLAIALANQSLEPGQRGADAMAYAITAALGAAVAVHRRHPVAAPHCLAGRAGRLRPSGLRAVPWATGVRAPLRPRRSGRERRDVRARDLGAASVDLRLVDVDLDGARTVGGLAVGRQRAQPAGAVDRARGPRGATRAKTRGTGEQGRRRGAAAHRPRAARHRGPLDERHRGAVGRGAPRDRHSAR